MTKNESGAAMTKPADGQNVFQRIAQWWKIRNCEHYWRPAIREVSEIVWGAAHSSVPKGILRTNKPFKVCDYCKKTVQLSIPEFYAQFGRMPW